MPWIVIVLLFAGCVSKPSYFVAPPLCKATRIEDIGVIVTFPPYLIDDRLPLKEGERMGYLSRRFCCDLEEFISRCLVQKMGGCLYPLGCESEPKRVEKIAIEELYYDKKRDAIFLQAVIGGKERKIVKNVTNNPYLTALEAVQELLKR